MSTDKAKVWSILAGFGDEGATVAQIADVYYGGRASSVAERKRLSDHVAKLREDGAVASVGWVGRGGIYRAIKQPADAPSSPWPAIEAALREAGDGGIAIAQIAVATGIHPHAVYSEIARARREGLVEKCGYKRVHRNCSPRNAYRLTPEKAPGVPKRVVPPDYAVEREADTPDELQRVYRALRSRGFAVAPIKGDRVLVGALELDVPDAVALARRHVSMAELLGVR